MSYFRPTQGANPILIQQELIEDKMLSHWTLLYSSVFLLHLSYFSSQLVSAAVAAVSLQSLTTSLSPLWVPHCCIKVGWVHYAHRLGLCRHLCRSTECQFVEGRTGSACQLQVRGHNHPPADRLLSILSFFRFCFLFSTALKLFNKIFTCYLKTN